MPDERSVTGRAHPARRARPLAAGIVAALLAAGALSGCGEKDEPELGETATTATTATVAGATAEIAGDWTGTLTQKGLQPFQVAVRIDPAGSGQVAYTGIRCGGVWTHTATEESAPPRYRFTETIDRGAGGECKGSGEISLVPRDATLAYTFAGEGITSSGTLTRADPTTLAPIFTDAGIAPPS